MGELWSTLSLSSFSSTSLEVSNKQTNDEDEEEESVLPTLLLLPCTTPRLPQLYITIFFSISLFFSFLVVVQDLSPFPLLTRLFISWHTHTLTVFVCTSSNFLLHFANLPPPPTPTFDLVGLCQSVIQSLLSVYWLSSHSFELTHSFIQLFLYDSLQFTLRSSQREATKTAFTLTQTLKTLHRRLHSLLNLFRPRLVVIFSFFFFFSLTLFPLLSTTTTTDSPGWSSTLAAAAAEACSHFGNQVFPFLSANAGERHFVLFRLSVFVIQTTTSTN